MLYRSSWCTIHLVHVLSNYMMYYRFSSWYIEVQGVLVIYVGLVEIVAVEKNITCYIFFFAEQKKCSADKKKACRRKKCKRQKKMQTAEKNANLTKKIQTWQKKSQIAKSSPPFASQKHLVQKQSPWDTGRDQISYGPTLPRGRSWAMCTTVRVAHEDVASSMNQRGILC